MLATERERRSPLFSLSGNDPVCHPHAGLVCLGGCFTVTTGAFFKVTPVKLVRPDGFEPPTTAFEAQCSIQLSYGRNRREV
jgi:hypothetical protein